MKNDQSSESHYERYERYGSVVTKDQLLILETLRTDKPEPDVTYMYINEYTFTGQLIGTKFTFAEHAFAKKGKLGISGGKIIVNAYNILLVNEDGSNPHRLEPPNKRPIWTLFMLILRGVCTLLSVAMILK